MVTRKAITTGGMGMPGSGGGGLPTSPPAPVSATCTITGTQWANALMAVFYVTFTCPSSVSLWTRLTVTAVKGSVSEQMPVRFPP